MNKVILLLFTATTLFIGFSFINVSFLKNPNNKLTNENVISYLKTLRKGVLESSILTIEAKQKIVNINTKKGIIKGTFIPYIYALEVTSSTSKPQTVYFTQKELDDTTVFIPNGTTYIKAKTSDLHVGDTVLLERAYKYNKNTRSFTEYLTTKITKINIKR